MLIFLAASPRQRCKLIELGLFSETVAETIKEKITHSYSYFFLTQKEKTKQEKERNEGPHSARSLRSCGCVLRWKGQQ